MNKTENFTFGIVGLGLMGGSLAKAIKDYVIKGNKGKILACDTNKKTLEEALLSGDIYKGYLPENINKMLPLCNVVFICLYPHATENFLLQNLNYFAKDSIITDIAGVKQKIIENVVPKLPKDITYIPGHPMAGSEREGYFHANSKIFQNRNYILVPLANTPSEKLEILKSIISSIGFKRIIETDAENHDNKIAFTSQLCHIIASVLVESAEDATITAFGGGSFEDLTRIAMINAPLWSELFLSNKKELLKHIESFENSLDKIKKLIINNEYEELTNTLEEVRKKRVLMAQTDNNLYKNKLD